MGLCKCPKKKVTNLFCFEHRVNVCEHCLISNHPKCVVQSYLQWLQDSDYDPTCRLCGKNLVEETEDVECVRLMCYDVFHWNCLDKYCSEMPANTAPAGYTCPNCKDSIFPARNVASPVAEILRKHLGSANWARAGLGMPLIENSASRLNTDSTQQTLQLESPFNPKSESRAPPYTSTPMNVHNSHLPMTHGSSKKLLQTAAAEAAASASPSPSAATAYARSDKLTDIFQNQAARKLFDSTRDDCALNVTHDHDENKYKRRSALQWLERWFSSRVDKSARRRDPHSRTKKLAIIIVVALIAFLTLILVFNKLGRASADSDPFLDPMANPNIRVGDN